MPVSWQSRCRPPAAPTIMTMPATLPRTRPLQPESKRSLRLCRPWPIAMRPTPARKRISGRPTPRTISRAGPPPSGSLGMSPMDWTISIISGIAVAISRTTADPPPCFSATGCDSGAGETDAAPKVATHHAQAAPRAASSTATGNPKSATRPHAASRMAAAAMGTGASTTTPWLAEIASASAVVAASRLDGFTPPIGRMRGVSTAKAAAGDAALPAIKPRSAAILAAPSRRQPLIFAMSRSPAPVPSARAVTKPAATITSPGEYMAREKPTPKALPRKPTEKPAAKPKAEAMNTIATNGWRRRDCVAMMRTNADAAKRSA